MKTTITTLIALMLFAAAAAQNPLTTDPGVTINGIRWATRNVDAPGTFTAHPEDPGMFYQWNSRVGWSATDPLVSTEGATTWNPNWDRRTSTRWHPTTNVCPAGWRIPTNAEQGLLAAAGSEWTTVNGINGRLFGSGHATIFLPAAGNRFYYNGNLLGVGKISYYWSSTPDGHYAYAMLFGIQSNKVSLTNSSHHADGFSVRCVSE